MTFEEFPQNYSNYDHRCADNRWSFLFYAKKLDCALAKNRKRLSCLAGIQHENCKLDSMTKSKNTDQPDENDAQADAGLPIVIKKYSNRRLYNTAESKYIVLQDVIDLINAGTEFRIEDAKSGDDITRAILNQIIFEQETQPNAFLFPLEFQKQLIRMYGDTYGHMIPDFLTQSINYFAAERSELASAWQTMMSQNTEAFLKQSEALAKQNMELFRKTWDVFGVMAEPETPETPKDEGDDGPELKDLQKQLDALQAQVKAMKS